MQCGHPFLRSLHLPAQAPQRGEPFERMLADVQDIILPGITHWQSPGFFAYFPGNSSPPSVLGELLAAGLGVQGMLWQTSPACTELEIRMRDWLAEVRALPECFRSSSGGGGAGGGVIQGTASDVIKIAMIRIAGRLQKERLASRMILQVHDELIFELKTEKKAEDVMKNKEHKELIEKIRKIMLESAKLDVPMEVEVGTSKNWADLKG